MKRKLSILGSTGSIGTQTLDVVSSLPDDFDVIGLFGGTNLELLAKQVLTFKPKFVGIKREEDIAKFCDLIRQDDYSPDIFIGEQGLVDFVQASSEALVRLMVIAITGTSSLMPTIESLNRSMSIAIASKEVLVAAGDIVMSLAQKQNVSVLPIDSEHAALKQCVAGVEPEEVKRLILTASGGPFRDRPASSFDSIKLSDALAHPNWTMGHKITIDSATMMNKGLEVIEAHHLFHMPYESIDVYVHPQSIVHSLVEFVDGNMISQMGPPDMRFPIQYALTYPKKVKHSWPNKDLTDCPKLEFYEPDFEKFPLLKLAYDVGKAGGSVPVVFNAANEAAVDLFLNERIHFTDIYGVVNDAVQQESYIANPSLDEIVALDKHVKHAVKQTSVHS